MTPNKVYIIDFDKLAEWSVATFLRATKHLGWLKSLLKPAKELYNDFVVAKNDGVYKVSHYGSITLLEKVLNDHFDNSLRRIYIKNAELADALRFYPLADAKEVGFYPDGQTQNGFNSAFSTDTTLIDFTVHIPDALQPGTELALNKYLIRVRSRVDFYKLYDKKYDIKWIS